MSSCKILYIEVGVGMGGKGWGLMIWGGFTEPAGMPLVGLERVNSRTSCTTLCGHLTTFYQYA